MTRKISWHLYLLAFIFASIVFIGGILVGKMVDENNLQTLKRETASLTQKLSSVHLMMLMDEEKEFCEFYERELENLEGEIEKIGYKLSYLEEIKNIYDKELKKEYFILEAQAYFLTKKIERVCGRKYVTIINFYTNSLPDGCEKCRRLGENILKAREELEIPLKLYSFDGELESTVVEGFKNKFNVTSYPTVIINDKKYEGVLSVEEIKKISRESYDKED